MSPAPHPKARVGVVVIGRNEGERLKACLRSIVDVGPIAYVDSGSTDGSRDFARALDVQVVELTIPPNFTAARARNAGVAALLASAPGLEFVQMVDGDCVVQPGWIDAGATALKNDSQLGAVFGRLRERYPERSIYNALCDLEWNVPVGEVLQVGGNAMLRLEAFREAGGYNDAMIAGEEPDMAARMRARGWRMQRIDAEMALHDAAITRFGQWWRRTRRSGHAYAELALRNPGIGKPDWSGTCRRIILWGGVLPIVALTGILMACLATWWWLIVPIAVAGLALLNVLRLIRHERRKGLAVRMAAARGAWLVLGKLPQFLGLLSYYRNHLAGRRSQLIEYKGSEG